LAWTRNEATSLEVALRGVTTPVRAVGERVMGEGFHG